MSLISASGDPQYLLFELVTNSIDGILERQAAQLRQAGESPPDDPRALATQMWTGSAADIADRIVLRVRDSGESLRPTFTMQDRKGIGIAPAEVRRTIMSLGQSPKNLRLYLAGAFGKGGGTLHRESRGAIIVGRPSPELCDETGCEDEIWVTAVWATHTAGGKVRRWVYAVTDPFDADQPATTGGILLFPAAGVDFEPGVMVTHVAYNAPYLARHTKAAIDSRSLWVMGNTRLYDPVLPWSYVDERDGTGEPRRIMYGRARNFRDGSPQQMRESPLVAQVPVQDPDTGEVYELSLAAFLFDKAARRNASDVVIIDTPPYLTDELEDIFQITNLLIIPCKASLFDALAIRQTLAFIENSKRANDKNFISVIVLTMVISGSNIQDQIREVLKQHKTPILDTEIGNRIAYAKSLLLTGSIVDDDTGKAKDEIENLATEILTLISKK